MIVFNDPQGSAAWFAARAGCVTASTFAAVMAKPTTKGEAADRRNLRADIVCETLSGLPNEPGFQSYDMKIGIEREPLAKLTYEIRTGSLVENVGFIRHDTLAAGASLDGRIGSDGGIECKCPKRATHIDYLRLPAGECPSIYRAQIMGQMWIAGLRWIDFVSFCPSLPEGLQLAIRRVPRDQPYIDRLAAEVTVFLDEVREEVVELLKMKAAQEAQ